MTPQEFIAKWQRANLSERASAQEHFIDICHLLGHPTPAEADPDGTDFTFERGVRYTQGGNGWADVWKRGCFGWEYKGRHKDLIAAYDQLNRYREALENPPLLVVCDTDKFEIHTNFTGTPKRVYAFDLAGLDNPANLDVLRNTFEHPDALKPGITTRTITEEVAERFGQLADGLRQRGIEAMRAAHFLMKLMFCMFGQDIKLLPEKLFHRVLENNKQNPAALTKRLRALFHSMATGDDFGADAILHFNGGLFSDDDAIDLTRQEIEQLIDIDDHDWSAVEPSIFGTLFERTLDPAKRSQIGAHYTSEDDIRTLVEPVVMKPLRQRWDEVRQECDELWAKNLKARAGKAKPKGREKSGLTERETKERRAHDRKLQDFLEFLGHVHVLDPACGSGNFLYVTIRLLLDLEKEVITYGATRGTQLLPQVRPTQLAGIEINEYARELAQVVIWIGYLQWKRDNGFEAPRNPVLEPIDSIQYMDAILDLSDPEHPREPNWPKTDFIVGNPPFLGGKLLRANLGSEYVDGMFAVWDERVPREADLCCYWFEKARAAIRARRCHRAGLLATQGIRGGANRRVLQQIKETGDIFFAESDRDWVLNGAAVHVSMVGFDDGNDTDRVLDQRSVADINANLSATADVTRARRLNANLRVSFMGDTKGGAFDIADALARDMLPQPNPHASPNSNVVVPWINGLDITRRARAMWIIDFGVDRTQADAALYERPFGHLTQHVLPLRRRNRRVAYRERWWIHVEPRPQMRARLQSLSRFIVTTTISKHRLFAWSAAPTLPDHQLIAFALDDDYSFGVLHSRLHEVWALRLGTQLETRPRYTPTSCFETFPFPEPTSAQRAAIATAARELDQQRTNWLNPPEWTREEVLEFPGSVDGPWARYLHDPNARGIGTVRYPRLVPRDEECARQLARRTLTNLYNERPTWLDLAHRRLDDAVFAAYGWPNDLTDDDILARLLELNLAREPT